MRVGVPTEIKTDEYRVALTPAGSASWPTPATRCVVQAGAGRGLRHRRRRLRGAGRDGSLPDADAVFAQADLIVKVKEPQPVEVARLEPRHTLFTYLHLAPDPELTQGLIDSGATCIAYETVTDTPGRLPLLAPMSEVAGKIATQAGAFMLERPLGGRGLLLGGVAGRRGGQGARHRRRRRRARRRRTSPSASARRSTSPTAASTACASSTPSSPAARRRSSPPPWRSSSSCRTWTSSSAPCSCAVRRRRSVITRAQLALMKRNAVLVDISIDQGGCFETSRPTTHTDPTYEVDGVTHYCVANMPGAVPITSTYALTNATMPYVLKLAEQGAGRRADADPGFLAGLNVCGGRLTYEPVARDQGLEWTDPMEALGALAPPSTIDAATRRSSSSSHGPCAVRRSHRSPDRQTSSCTGRSDGSASPSGANRCA